MALTPIDHVGAVGESTSQSGTARLRVAGRCPPMEMFLQSSWPGKGRHQSPSIDLGDTREGSTIGTWVWFPSRRYRMGVKVVSLFQRRAGGLGAEHGDDHVRCDPARWDGYEHPRARLGSPSGCRPIAAIEREDHVSNWHRTASPLSAVRRKILRVTLHIGQGHVRRVAVLIIVAT